MQYALPALVAAAFACTATVWDLRKRLIPNALNYSFLAAGAALALAQGIFSVGYVGLVALSFAFAYALYKAGVWAGGDAKFFTALSSFLPFFWQVPLTGWNVFSFLAIFFYSVAAGVPVTLLACAPKLWLLRGELASLLRAAAPRAFSAALASAAVAFALQKFFALVPQAGWVASAAAVVFLLAARVPLAVSAAVFVAALALDPLNSLELFAGALAVSWLALFAWQALALARNKVLRRHVRVDELEEGMIPAYSVVVDESGRARELRTPGLKELLAAAGKADAAALARLLKPRERIVADSRLARGLSETEIKELKALGVKSLVVRESIAFAPVMVAGFALAALLGVKWLGF
ncbi:MAG: prepilin peptidase [Candidatus Micrarchaeia archaeon]|jgi:Flp pilus assembly protein protease CpaA